MAAGEDPAGVPPAIRAWLERVAGLSGARLSLPRPATAPRLPVQDGDQLAAGIGGENTLAPSW
ncbi:hypothetical protein [Sinosporangium siamense]|uniref:Uncharacterized protein n=1 Tax=Sinosporangium siamense TaxID=1367973 RepID=A0A919RID4_9ACTN|nr:hypothetical protein [Sinosporangium siamense]GII94378.1 hypothetical protein Ssi02_46090 [Sinosporangium siamense]